MEKQNENFFVQVTLTPEQARTVVSALDLLTRIHIGQFNTVREQFWGKLPDRDAVDRLEKLLYEARRIVFPELNGGPGHSFGISGCPSKTGKIAYDVLQVIRQTEALGRIPEGGITVNFNDPLFVSDSVPRPTAKRVTILDRLADV